MTEELGGSNGFEITLQLRGFFHPRVRVNPDNQSLTVFFEAPPAPPEHPQGLELIAPLPLSAALALVAGLLEAVQEIERLRPQDPPMP